jgi:hypothetical protein
VLAGTNVPENIQRAGVQSLLSQERDNTTLNQRLLATCHATI